MVMSRGTNVVNAGTMRIVSVTITIPVSDVCYAFAADVGNAHPKCSSCLGWRIVMLNMVIALFSGAHVMLYIFVQPVHPDVQSVPPHVMLFRGAICASRRRNVGHSTTHCGLSPTIYQPGYHDYSQSLQHSEAEEDICCRYQASPCANVLVCLSLESPGEDFLQISSSSPPTCVMFSKTPVIHTTDDCYAGH